MGGAGVVCTHISIMHARPYVCTDMEGAYGGRWASDGVLVTRQTL